MVVAGNGGMKRSPLPVYPIFLPSPLPAWSLACSVERCQGSEGRGWENSAMVNSQPIECILRSLAPQGYWTRTRILVFLCSDLSYRKCQWLPVKALFKQSPDPKAGCELQRADFIERWHGTALGSLSGCLRTGKHPWPASSPRPEIKTVLGCSFWAWVWRLRDLFILPLKLRPCPYLRDQGN